MKVYNPDDFEYSKEKTSYIKFECMSCNKPVVLPARFSDGHRCRFCNGHMRPVSYVRRKEDIGKIRKDSEDIGKMECSLGG